MSARNLEMRPLFWLAAVLLLLVTRAQAVTFDSYGGLIDVPCSNGPAPHFYTQKIGHRWVMCTPAGNTFFENKPSNIVVNADAMQVGPQGISYHDKVGAKYGTSNNYAAWTAAQVDRLKAWGFNTIGEYSDGYLWEKMPWEAVLHVIYSAMKNTGNYIPSATKGLMALNPAYYNGYYAKTADFYDPNWIAYTNAFIAHDLAGINTLKNSPMLIQIETDDRDQFYGWGPGGDYGYGSASVHLGWVTLAASPKQWTNSGLVYPDPVVYTKRAFRDYLQAKYGAGSAGLAALNLAWNSSYTTWDTSGVNYIETLCSGQWDAVKTSCSTTLAHNPVTANSVALKVNGAVWAGDNSHWIGAVTPPTGDILGPQAASGSVTYASGALTWTFNSAPPAGAIVTVDYDAGGWGYGNGLLDEDGRHAWVCTDWVNLNNCSASVKADLDGFLYPFAKQYTANMSAIIHAAYPGILIGGMGTLSNPDGGKTRDPFIKAMAEDFDIVYAAVGSPTLTVDAATAQRVLDDTYAAMGTSKKPILPQREIWANDDSPYSAYPSGICYGCAKTQAEKGQAYYDWMNWMLHAHDTASGDYPIVALQFWSFRDKPSEHKNFGLVSDIDNAYDGKEAAAGSHACSAPIQTYTCGGEAANYGDALTQVTQGNSLWWRILIDTTAPSAPLDVTGTALSDSQIRLNWRASADPDSPVSGYQIFRNGVQVATSAVTSYTDTGLWPSLTYRYQVAAYDLANNISALSSTAAATTLVPAVPPILVNSGGSAYTDSLGRLWSADSGFTGGTAYRLTNPIQGTADSLLYQTERYGQISYQFNVPNGSYMVTLKFADEAGWGARVFNVAINGQQVLSNFDVVSSANGSDAGVDRAFTIPVTSGLIAVQFIPVVDVPIVNAIQIQYISSSSSASACDVNADGATNVVDVQQEVNQALGIAACTADINKDGACNVVDVQRVVNAALGGQCVSP